MEKNHGLNGAQLEIRPHDSFFERPVSQPNEHEVQLTKSIPVDEQVMLFIFESYKADFTEIHDMHDVKINWEEGASSITVTPVDKASADKNSFDTACEDIASFLDVFVTTTTHVLPEAWPAVVDYVNKNSASVKEELKFQYLAQQHTIALTGKKKDVERLVEELQELKTKIEKRINLEASKTTYVIDIPQARLQILRDLDFAKELETEHEETEVSILLDKGQIHIRAPPDTVYKVSSAIWEAVANIREISLEMSQNPGELLRSTECQGFMKNQFTANNLQATLAFDAENKKNIVVVTGIKSGVVERASELVKTLLVEECLDVDEDHVQLEKSDKWRQLIDELTEKRILSLSFDRSNKKIWLAGTKEDISFALAAVKRFWKEQKELQELQKRMRRKQDLEASKTTYHIDISPIRLQFLRDLGFAKELEAQHEETEVTILLDKGKVQIRAPQDTVHMVSVAIWEAVANIRELSLEISQNAVEILTSTECQAFMKDLFTANNLQASLAFDPKNKENMVVVGMKTEVIEKASELVKTLVVEECLDLAENRVKLERSEKCHQYMPLEASKTTTFIENISPMRLKFLRDVEFEKELETKHEGTQVRILLEEGKVQVCAPHSTVHKVSAAVWEALANMKELRLEMSQNAVEMVRSRAFQAFMKDQFTANNLQAALALDAESMKNVVVMGIKTEIAEKASELVKRLVFEELEYLDSDEDRVQLEKSDKWHQYMTLEASKTATSKRTTFIENISQMKLKFLRDLDFEKELETQHEETQVSILLEKGKVQVRAPFSTIHKVSAAVWEALANMRELRLEMSQIAVELLRSRACQAFMKDQFTAKNLQATLAFDAEKKETVVVMGMKSEVAEKASELVKRLIVEECVDLDDDQVQLNKSEKWHQLRHELTQKRVLSLSFDRSNRKIWLVGTKEDVSFALGAVKRFLKENTIVNDVENISQMKLKFLRDLDFEKELETQHEETQVSILLEKGKVQIRAPFSTIHKVSAAVWEALANMRELRLEMSQIAVELLRSRACQAFMKDQFTAKNLQATLAFDAEKKETVVVMGMKSEVAEKASELVKRLIVEECVDLDDDQVQLNKSEKWHQLRHELTQKRVLSLSFVRSNRKIWLVGTKEDVSFALGAVKRFLKENTIVNDVVVLPRGCRRFLSKFREQELRKIEDGLKEHFTRIKGVEGKDDEDLVVSGTTDGVDKATNLIQDLASKVVRRKVFLNKPGMRKVLDRSKGKKLLSLLENENKCVIEHFVPEKDAASKKREQEEDGEEENKKKKESLCNFLTPEGKNILVYKDNICDRDVDVIVNAANSNLRHVGGVSKAIAEAAGEEIKDECERYIIDRGPVLEGQVVVTSAGKLPFKKVIHAVGPHWRKEVTREKAMGKSPREEKLLRYAVTNALDAAKNFKSIAIPAIGTGIYDFPRELCAQIMVDSALAFSQENPGCRLSVIEFTSVDDDVVTAFVTEMDSRFLHDPDYQKLSKGKIHQKVKAEKVEGKRSIESTSRLPTAPDIPPFPYVLPQKGMKSTLVTGDWSPEQASYRLFNE